LCKLMCDNHLLEELNIWFLNHGFHIFPFMRDAILPKLRKFALFTSPLDDDTVLEASRFFTRHPSITSLTWYIHDQSPTIESSFPSLNHLIGYGDGVAAILSNLTEVPPTRSLRAIGKSTIDEKFWRTVACNINPEALQVLMVSKFATVEDIFRVADGFPDLRRLEVDVSDEIRDVSLQTYRMFKRAEWIEVLKKLPYLQVFRGVSFLDDRQRGDEDYENDERMDFLTRLLPDLEFIDHWTSSNSNLLIQILRNRNQDGSVNWKTVTHDSIRDFSEPDAEWLAKYGSLSAAA